MVIKNILIGWYRYLANITSKETVRRKKICARCQYNEGNWCIKCGCFIPSKIRVEDEKCKLNKW